ncbi:MucR family transcriptional regulator [Phyllobacterium sophorae]|uniref:Transcriptional regulator n=1 Tax=Phyllobacterium sophorae TaxID=1520277 RepID=A0A2P7B6J6_9HYPH|nr:MucR family transcriptional regulator [Phyllobacterium sophorae]PSH62093.1 transcriptional regulator [Phyllobacterium sophorae]
MSALKAKSELLIELTAGLVAAYVGKNAQRPADLPDLIANVYAVLANLDTTKEESAIAPVRSEPAVNPKKSITPDYLICLEDGKKFKSLKRHLSISFGLTPQQYRQRWDLDPTYPMVAPNYQALRSAIAKRTGLGRKPKSVPA